MGGCCGRTADVGEDGEKGMKLIQVNSGHTEEFLSPAPFSISYSVWRIHGHP